MDVYWVQEGGGDPVAYLKNRPSQFKAVHIKDEKEIGASGKMNFKPILTRCTQIISKIGMLKSNSIPKMIRLPASSRAMII